MHVFLIHAGDADFSRELPGKLDRSPPGPQRVKLMAFPPLGIQTLAPVLRRHGHQVRMFDTCHPEMKPEYLAHAVSQQHPDVIGISFLSTTTYPAAKSVAARLTSVAPATPIIVGGPPESADQFVPPPEAHPPTRAARPVAGAARRTASGTAHTWPISAPTARLRLLTRICR